VPSRTPDLTAAQWLAVVTWIAGQAIAFGWLSSLPSQIALSAGATVLALAWKWADAHIRGRRAGIVAAGLYSNAAIAARGLPLPGPPYPPKLSPEDPGAAVTYPPPPSPSTEP
jgi:hypothetical protein